ncbi:DUF1622 domain-containing protein [Mycolicibacterium aubagnense]|nr:DUF1622 domain-containing protein [Mycolicibacterium aubagnense]TLH61100.1 hypothetical protein C1S80_16435 [Mycolicibacterium aubagnense]WGI35025.1 DUF1622 domain-containing protein [Mycolicibacterium aubagnense]
MAFYDVVETTGKVIDAVGVAVIVGGAVIALAATMVRVRGTEGESAGGVYDAFRRQLGRSILLGLEFLVAADIIRTVAVTPTAQSVAVLAGIVAIRTFLSFSLQVEMTGSWPWQRPAKPVDDRQPK